MMLKKITFSFCAVVLSADILLATSVFAKDEVDEKGQLPRFVSMRSDEVNIRTGPGVRYPIKWVIKRKSMPVEIIAVYEDWRKIRDVQQDEGWTHKAMLSGKRTGMVKADKKNIFSEADAKSKVVAVANKGTILTIDKCDGKYCEVESKDVDGFIKQDNLFGVYENEKIKD